MTDRADGATHDFAAGLALGRQWADGVHDEPTRIRFIDAAVIHGLPGAAAEADDAGSVAIRLAASILGMRCDDDAAAAFWSMVAPGVRESDMSHWFFNGFIAGAAEVFRDNQGDEFAELRRLVRDPTLPN